MTNPTLTVAEHIANNTTFADRCEKPIAWQVKVTLAQYNVTLSKECRQQALERLKTLINQMIKEDMKSL